MDYLTRMEAMEELRISKRTLDRLLIGGKLKSAKIGRRRLIPREELQTFVKEHMNTGGNENAGNDNNQ